MKESFSSFSPERFNNHQSIEMVDFFRKSTKQYGIVQDIDEALVDTVSRHVKFLTKLGRLRNPSAQMPTLEEVCAAGGTQYIYKELLGYGDEWDAIMERLRGINYVNRNAPPLHPSLSEQMSLVMGEKVDLIGYLTARPLRNGESVEITQQDLHTRLHLPERPLVMRPSEVDIKQTAAWKLTYLEQIAAAKTEGYVILVDDSISTAKAIAERNQVRIDQGLHPIMQIVVHGPLTIPVIQSGAFTDNSALGIYHANWDTMPGVMSTIKLQWY